MNIWVIADSYPTKRYPLTGIFELDQAEALAKTGQKVFMLCPDIRSIRRIRKLGWKFFSHNGVEICSYAIPIGAFPYPIKLFFSKLAFRKLAKAVIKKYGMPDIAHAHFFPVAAAAADHCKKLNIPLVVTEHSSQLNDTWSEETKEQVSDAFKTAKKIITVSSPLGRNIRENIGFESCCVPNVVDVKNFSGVTREKHDGFVFMAVGTLTHRKGFDLLIGAFSEVCKKRPDAKLIICGDGEEKHALIKQAEALKVIDKISFVGQLSRAQIAECYRQVDAFVLASRMETFGVVYIEAMASGIPVIATECGGPEDFVTKESGYLIPCDDNDALASAMLSMINDYSAFDSEYIKNYTLERFSDKAVSRQLLEIYKDALYVNISEG